MFLKFIFFFNFICFYLTFWTQQLGSQNGVYNSITGSKQNDEIKNAIQFHPRWNIQVSNVQNNICPLKLKTKESFVIATFNYYFELYNLNAHV